jgi:hypothetical protein
MPADTLASELSGPQLQVLHALLSGHTVTSAAQACGVPDRTIRDWKHHPAFRTALHEGQAQLLQETRTLLAVAAAEAVKALVQVCQDPLEKGSTRVAAAGRLLTLLFRHVPAEPIPMPQLGNLVALYSGEQGINSTLPGSAESVGGRGEDVAPTGGCVTPHPRIPNIPLSPSSGTNPGRDAACPGPTAEETSACSQPRKPAESGEIRRNPAAYLDAAPLDALPLDASCSPSRPPLLAGHPFGPLPDLHGTLLRAAPKAIPPDLDSAHSSHLPDSTLASRASRSTAQKRRKPAKSGRDRSR